MRSPSSGGIGSSLSAVNSSSKGTIPSGAPAHLAVITWDMSADAGRAQSLGLIARLALLLSTLTPSSFAGPCFDLRIPCSQPRLAGT
jgi:hypothetical protein